MKDVELTARGKAAFGGLCAACCGLPMLVLLGVVSVGVAITAGIAVASTFAVLIMAYRVARQRATHVPDSTRRLLVAVGVGLSTVGVWLARSSDGYATAVLSVAVASLAIAALEALMSSRTDQFS